MLCLPSLARQIFMVQLVKSRISSCKTTCSLAPPNVGTVICEGKGDQIAPRRRPRVIHFTVLSNLILRNSASERAMVDHGQRLPYVAGAGRGARRSFRERWPHAIRPFSYPPPLQSFSPLWRKERERERERESQEIAVLFCMP